MYHRPHGRPDGESHRAGARSKREPTRRGYAHDVIRKRHHRSRHPLFPARFDHPRRHAQHAVEGCVHRERDKQPLDEVNDAIVVGVQSSPVASRGEYRDGHRRLDCDNHRERDGDGVSRARGGVRAELVAAPGQHRDAEPDGDHERERVGHLKDGHRGDVQLGVGQPPREEDVHLRRPPLRHHQDPGNRQPEELAPSRGGGAKTPPVPRRLPGEVALDEGEVADVDAQDDAVGPRGGERRARVSEPEDADEDDVRGDVKERGDDARDRTGSGDALGLHVGLRGDVPRVEEETGDETREVRGGGAGDVRVLTHGEKRGLGGGPQRGDGEGREGEDEERALGDVPEGGVGAGAVGLAADGGDGGRHPDEDRVSGDVSEGRGERGARQREGAEVAHERHGREAHDAIADHAQADRERQVELGSSLAAETAQRHRRLALLILAQRVVVVERIHANCPVSRAREAASQHRQTRHPRELPTEV